MSVTINFETLAKGPLLAMPAPLPGSFVHARVKLDLRGKKSITCTELFRCSTGIEANSASGFDKRP